MNTPTPLPPVKIERICYCCSKCGVVIAYEEQPCPLCASRSELAAATKERDLLEQARNGAVLAASQFDKKWQKAEQERDEAKAALRLSTDLSERYRLTTLKQDADLTALRAEVERLKETIDKTEAALGGLRPSEGYWDMVRRIRQAESDNAKLRAALEPLNKMYDFTAISNSDKDEDAVLTGTKGIIQDAWGVRETVISVGNLREARAALASTEAAKP